MSSDSSHSAQLTLWMQQLRDLDSSAAQRLWEQYAERLVAVARERFGSESEMSGESEAAALSAFESFCAGVQQDRFTRLNDRDNLWRLLVSITARKVAERQQHAQEDTPATPDDVPEPTPEFAEKVADECEALIDGFEEKALQQITQLKLEGCSNEQIANQLGCTRRSVERKLIRIRLEMGDNIEDEV